MAAAARPYWTGFLKLSLVTISVRLYTATTERERIRFQMIHEPPRLIIAVRARFSQ